MEMVKRMDNINFYTGYCIDTYMLSDINTINNNAFAST